MNTKTIVQLILSATLILCGALGPVWSVHAQAGTGKTMAASWLAGSLQASDSAPWQISYRGADAALGLAAEVEASSKLRYPGMQKYANVTLKRGLMKSEYGAIYCSPNGPVGYFTGVFLETAGEQTVSHPVALVVGPGERTETGETMKFEIAGESFGRTTVELPGTWIVDGEPCR